MSMTPDKTLEELASKDADKLTEDIMVAFGRSFQDGTNIQKAIRELLLPVVAKSATAAQQREVERLQALLKESVAQELPRLEEVQLIYKVTALEEQLRTERERNKWATQHIKDLLLSADSSWMNGDAGHDWPQAVLAAEKFIRPAPSHSGKEGV